MDQNELDELKQKIQMTLDEAQARLNEIINIVGSVQEKDSEVRLQLQGSIDESQTKLKEITVIADSSKQKEEDLNIHHARILELKGSVESNSTSLTETYKAALEVKSQIDELLTQSTQAKNSIEQLLNNSVEKNTEIETYFNSFQELKSKVEDPENGVASLFDKTKELYGQVITTSKEANAKKEEVINNKLQSDNLVKDTIELKGKVASALTDSENYKRDIGKILDLVRDTGLSNSFDQRRKRSQWSSVFGIVLILVGVSISIYSINHVFFSEKGNNLFSQINNDYIKFLLRLTLTAPGVFITWFAAEQYTKERFFLEQYEFKTAAALALENYTKLLKDNYKEKTNEIFDLNIKMIEAVYKEPIYFKPKTSFFSHFKIPYIGAEAKAQIENEEQRQ